MTNTFSLEQISKTDNLDANLISRQYNFNVMAPFMELKYINSTSKQSEIANKMRYVEFYSTTVSA